MSRSMRKEPYSKCDLHRSSPACIIAQSGMELSCLAQPAQLHSLVWSYPVKPSLHNCTVWYGATLSSPACTIAQSGMELPCLAQPAQLHSLVWSYPV
ncbi:hypothetical protein DPMN_007374 [Dreissena polymorpha]|uniref:Uncharacterized protein n=1 Tax=Dreissena polymorpha TaxID=45954 RepID=A0A9D4MX94_DREPO|nr:hypothetical protein DPMN_007374 [Dreissena polymorpha]